MKTLLVSLAASLSLSLGYPGATKPTGIENTVSDLGWLAGHWRGEGLGGECEEIWSAPMAGTMVGSFRLVKDGKVQFYELMVLTPVEEGLALKVKHFTADFVGWEEKEEAVSFPLEELSGHRARFRGLTMVREGDELEITVRIKYDDGTVVDEPFRFRRFRVGS